MVTAKSKHTVKILSILFCFINLNHHKSPCKKQDIALPQEHSVPRKEHLTETPYGNIP